MAPALDLIGGAGGAAASWLVDVGLVRSSVLLIMAGACVLSLRRSSAAARHLVLAVALAALLLLPAATLLAPGWRLLPGGGGERAAVSQAAVLPAGPVGPAGPGPRQAPPEPAAGPSAPAAPPVSASSPFPTGAVILGAWLAGVLAVVLRLGVGTARLAGIRRRAAVPSAAITARGLRRARELGLARRVEVLLSTEVSVPFTFGLRRPVVLLPQSARTWQGERLDAVLSHELAHVRRRDCRTQAMATLACGLLWFNPLVWLAAWRLRAERERACDDLVLGLGVRATDYASQLVAIARTGLAARAGHGPAVAMARGSGLERRVRAILDGRQRRRAPSRLAVAVVLLAAIGVAAPLAALAAQGPGAGAPAAVAASGPVPLSVLTRPRTAADRLPRWVSSDPVVRRRGIHSQTTRLALTEAGRRYYVVEARATAAGPLSVCLIDAPLQTPPRPASPRDVLGPGGAGGVNCQTEGVFGSYFMAAPMSLRSSGGRTVADVDGIVPDGFTTVTAGTRTARVVANVFVLRGVDPSLPLVARGPGGRRTYFLGFARPAPRPLPGALLPVSLLRRPLTPADRPPLNRAHLAPGGAGNTDWRRARLGATVGRVSYYVAPTLDPHLLMVLEATGGRIGGVGGVLRPAAGVPFSFMTLGEGPRQIWAPGRYTLVGVAADGYDRVSAAGRTAPVRDNFFVLTGVETLGVTRVTASGPAGRASMYIAGGPGQSREHIPSGVARRP